MKTVLSYILFFTLAIRPLYNMGYVAYYEANIDYIIETYCVNKEKPKLQCNGKCHLTKQLNTNTTSDSYLSSIYEAFVPVYFQEYKLAILINNGIVLTDHNWTYSKTYKSLFLGRKSPPPKV